MTVNISQSFTDTRAIFCYRQYRQFVIDCWTLSGSHRWSSWWPGRPRDPVKMV